MTLDFKIVKTEPNCLQNVKAKFSDAGTKYYIKNNTKKDTAVLGAYQKVCFLQ